MAEHNRALLFPFFLLLTLLHHFASAGVESLGNAGGSGRLLCSGSVKLFVFGDSYADTGNSRKQFDVSWKLPYGMTFPGKPTGRFSDGRVLTDYIASFLGIQSPVPYKWRNVAEKSREEEKGMNFAHGGTGVFNTIVNQPNMTAQIDMFQNLLDEGKAFTKQNLNSSIALVSLAGNDYATFLANHGNLEDIRAYTASIIRQLVMNVRRIQSLGVPKMAVTAIEPMGCIPQLAASFSSSNYQNCSDIWNSISIFHNQMLQQEMQKLNKEQSHEPPVAILDLYSAFMSAIEKAKGSYARNNLELRPVLKPCCEGVSSGFSCGSLGTGGERKYTVCKTPNESIFWDTIHPTQNAWHQAYSVLEPSLHQLCH